jgi:hypothetical protein
MILTVSKSERGFIRDCKTAKEAWGRIIDVHEPRLASNVLHLRKELYQCRLEDTSAKGAMQAHIGRMRNLIDLLANISVTASVQEGVQQYLSLPDAYSHIAAALSLKPVIGAHLRRGIYRPIPRGQASTGTRSSEPFFYSQG